MSFVLVMLLAVPEVSFQYLGLWNDSAIDLARSWMFSAVLYLVAIVYLLRYVFQPRVMTADKLFGAAAAYLMLGVLCFLAWSLQLRQWPFRGVES